MYKENSLQENFQRAKKNKHNYSIASEAFSLIEREFIVYNISLKKDYTDQYDYINYRRGLSYLEEIVDFKHSEPIIARKGLRKFKDLLPEYLEIKESHINKSKFHQKEKHNLFDELESFKGNSYVIYNTEKLNGENAQISFVHDNFWVIGSKNKCILLSNYEDCQKLKNIHEHKLTLLIAKSWFSLLQKKSPEQINAIKLELSKKTLIGQYCNTENNQHLVDYGKDPQLFFYALVQKDNLIEDCLPTSMTFKFLQTFNLPRAKSENTQCSSYEQTLEKLRDILVKMNEKSMKEGGEGSVVYVGGKDHERQQILLVCKLKTIEYRIFRKLREKLKIYIQKYNKNYDNLLKKYTKEITEISREFKLVKPLQYYIELGRRSFILCEDQTKNISRFIGNRYIHFMILVDKNISKEKFLEIVDSKTNDYLQEQQISSQIKGNSEENQEQKQQSDEKTQKKQQVQEKMVNLNKRVVVIVPITIPSTGKTSLLEIINASNPPFKIWSLSSDDIRRKIMDQMMKKMKNVTKKQAFQKSRDRANKDYYKALGQIFKSISTSKETDHVLYLDKNHPESALKPGLKQINEKSSPFTNLEIVKIGLFPNTIQKFEKKGLYHYPFSIPFMLTCLKRVLNRPQHQTLQGNDEQRCKIVIGFCNLFRNFSMSAYHVKKYFDDKLEFKFNNEECCKNEADYQLIELFKQILLKGAPGSFQVNHPRYDGFIKLLRDWKLQEIPQQKCAEQALNNIVQIFKSFQNIKSQPTEQIQ